MADLTFDIAPRRKEPITFDLKNDPNETPGSETYLYTFIPPKTAVLMLPLINTEGDFAAMRGTIDWFKAGLSTADWEHLDARMSSDDDGFDIENLTDVVRGLNEKISSRPTT